MQSGVAFSQIYPNRIQKRFCYLGLNILLTEVIYLMGDTRNYYTLPIRK